MVRLDLPDRDIVAVRAPNPGPFTLSGTNTWFVGRGPTWLIDPGPSLPEHLDALAAEAQARGGLGAILLTHDHADHSEGAGELRRRTGAPVMGMRGDVQRRLADGDEVGPLRAVATPGHAPDHLSYLHGAVLFSGDAVLGQGSVFISPYPGALAAYLQALERLRALPLELICPAHGPIVEAPAAKLEEYIGHRAERERRLLGALASGRRTVEELLGDVWADAPEALRPAATVTLAAHLDKLEGEGRLPEGVERPSGWPAGLRGGG